MAKTLSRFYFLKKDEYKEKATLFVRVQDPNRRIDVQFTTRIQVGVPEWKAAVADEDSLARHRKQNPKLHDKLGRIEVMLEREMSAPNSIDSTSNRKYWPFPIRKGMKSYVLRRKRNNMRGKRRNVSGKNRSGLFRQVLRQRKPRYGIIFQIFVLKSSQVSA